MKKITLCDNEINNFEAYLRSEERSSATVSKYLHDVRCLALYAGGRAVDKSLIVEYKAYLGERYAVTSANSMLAAVNAFFKYLGRYDLTVKQFKVQKSVCRLEEKELTVRIPECAPAYDYVMAL